MVWKNTIATDHAEGEPPSRGSTILVNIGSIWNKSAALRKMAAMNVASSAPGDCAVRRIASVAGGSAMVRVLACSFPLRDLWEPGPFRDPRLEVPEVLVQLLERKAERKEVLQRIAGQGARKTLATDG